MKPLPHSKLTFASADGYYFIDPHLLILCTADGNYTTLYLAGEKKLLICRQLGQIEPQLPATQFMRVHHSHIVNLNYLKKFCRENGGCIVLTNGQIVPVARRRRMALLSRMTWR